MILDPGILEIEPLRSIADGVRDLAQEVAVKTGTRIRSLTTFDDVPDKLGFERGSVVQIATAVGYVSLHLGERDGEQRIARRPEEQAVRDLGDSIGYGRLMQLAERIWNAKQPGAAHSVGCCVAFLVPCPCPESGRDANGFCDWCCGSGRVTKKVLEAIQKLG